MNSETFKKLLMELDENSVETLSAKNVRYSSGGDALHNFNAGGEVFGGTPAQACWGYLTKHLVALRDMVQKNDFSNRADFLEKCQDSINYIRFLWCIGNEEREKMKSEVAKEPEDEIHICRMCHERIDSRYCISPNSGMISHLMNTHGIRPDHVLTYDELIKNFFDKESK